MIYEYFVEKLKSLSQARNYLVALSGGLDSCVLLHLVKRFAEAEKSTKIRVIHIHHGISSNADDWQKFCEQICQEYSLPLIVEKIQLNFSASEGLEAEARTKRYRVFENHLQENEALLTAHTLNDQAETFLLQLFRGAAAKGLSAMPVEKFFGKSKHLRPLLGMSREALEKYAQEYHLKWIEDESNQDERFDRNFLRASIIPLLKNRWPAVQETLCQRARDFAETAELFENLADLDLRAALTEHRDQLKIEPLLSLSLLRQKNALRRFFQLNQKPMPDRKRLDQIIRCLFLAAEDKNPCIRWKSIELHRFQGRLYLMRRLENFDAKLILPWNFEQNLKLPADLGLLKVEKKLGHGVRSNLDPHKITVRFRQGGESLRLNGQTQILKKLFQAWEIPPWQRTRIPCIFYEQELICIPGQAISDNFRTSNSEAGYFLSMLP